MDCSTPGFPVHHQLPELAQLMSIESVMPSNHLILSPLLLLPTVFPHIKVFSSESALHIMWSKVEASASGSVLPVNIQGCFPLGLTGLISLLFKALSRVFSVPHFENSVDSTHFVKIFRNVLIKVTVHSNGLEVQQRALCLSYTVTFLGMIEIKTCKKQEG